MTTYETIAGEKRNLNSPDEIYKTLIKPIRDEVLQEIINSVSSDVYGFTDTKFNWSERIEVVDEFKDTFIAWSKDWLKNLEALPHVYVINGNSESLIDLFHRTQCISYKTDDYSFYKQWHLQCKKYSKELTEPSDVDEIVASWPGYSKGDDTELNFARACNPKKIHLDCAYLGLTVPPKTPLDVTEFETVSVSFSKTLSIPYNRIGLLFSKSPIPSMQTLKNVYYANLSAAKLATEIMKKLPISYWWENYGGEKLKKICEIYNLKPVNSVLFAYDKIDRRVALSPCWTAEKFYCTYVDMDPEIFSQIQKELAQFHINNPVPDSYFQIINCPDVLRQLPTLGQWFKDNKIPRPIKVAHISTPPNTRQPAHRDAGDEILAFNLPVANATGVRTEMWDEEGLPYIKLFTMKTNIPYYRYSVEKTPPKASYILEQPVVLNTKKIHSVLNKTDLPRVSLSFRFERDPWHLTV